MIPDVPSDLLTHDFLFGTFDCENIPYKDEEFDLVIANHVLFYCENIDTALSEVNRVLKKGGRFICSTYGNKHMCEIDKLVKSFDNRINLSSNKLYEKFGLDNGEDFLKLHFNSIQMKPYEDYLEVDQAEPLMEYILSCHGNQNDIFSANIRNSKILSSRKQKLLSILLKKPEYLFV